MLKKSTSIRVLVVDDESLIRWSLTQTLEENGYKVVEAEDGRTALDAVSNADGSFDVVLLDFRLPDSNDLTLLSRLRAMAPNAQVILMTAYGTPEITQSALSAGAIRVLSKPFEMTELLEIVARASRSRPI
jgi:DNA-binding NtrC family response regulator